MPFPFVLPTTSAFSFSSSFSCESHPSLPLSASTYRGVVRETLKKHKRLPAASQPPNLPSVASSLLAYLPYLRAVDAGLGSRPLPGSREEVTVVLKTAPAIEWRPTLSDALVPGKEAARVRVHSLEYEVFFALSALANTHSLLARAALHPLYVTTTAPVGTAERQAAITAATKHLLDAAAIHDYLGLRAEHLGSGPPPPPCADIAPTTVRAQAALALAEATLLAVLKDDPYPAVVAQDRNRNDREWMFKAPDIPKVRAHLFARLCLAAAQHAAKAHSLCQAQGRGGASLRGGIGKGDRSGGGGGGAGGGGAGGGGGRISDAFLRYLEDLRRTSRAKACRFFGIDAELGGQTGMAIGWLHAGMQELGVEPARDGKKGIGLGGLSKLKKEWTEKREDRKVDQGANWGADAGRLEEIRVLEMLEAKWTKLNDTVWRLLALGYLLCGNNYPFFPLS